MTLEQLKIDLREKCPQMYFSVKLFQRDKQVYRRRTFGDLFLYYKWKGVTEQMLATALKEEGFGTYKCPDIQEWVFFRYGHYDYKYFVKPYNLCIAAGKVSQKYNFTYLNALYDSTIKE